MKRQNLRQGNRKNLKQNRNFSAHAEEIKLALSSSSDLFSAEGISILSMLREVKINLGKIRTFLAGRRESFYQN